VAHDDVVPARVARRALRPTGTDLAPAWRGRLHRWAAVVSAPAAVALVLHRPTPAVGGYAAGLVALFAVSAAYHLAPVSPGARQRWRRADHAVIYLFMVLSYIPFCQQAVGGTLGAVLLGLALAVGAAGLAVKLFGFRRSGVIGAVLYMVLGWMAAVALPGAVGTLPGAELGLLAATGLLYTGGAAVFARRWPDPLPAVFGYHEVWHACVVVAAACYFAFVWQLPTRG
jgi:hemolysin III